MNSLNHEPEHVVHAKASSEESGSKHAIAKINVFMFHEENSRDQIISDEHIFFLRYSEIFKHGVPYNECTLRKILKDEFIYGLPEECQKKFNRNFREMCPCEEAGGLRPSDEHARKAKECVHEYLDIECWCNYGCSCHIEMFNKFNI